VDAETVEKAEDIGIRTPIVLIGVMGLIWIEELSESELGPGWSARKVSDPYMRCKTKSII
jgi:hypothetical protein